MEDLTQDLDVSKEGARKQSEGRFQFRGTSNSFINKRKNSFYDFVGENLPR
jgi:hypothetical protein